MKFRVIAFVLCAIFCANSFCDDPVTVTIEPYTKEEFPEWAKHLRRTEIITFGSLPFVTLGTTLGFSIFRYLLHDMDSSYFPNPLAKTSSDANLTQEEQLTILAISAGISLVLGLTDLTVNLISAHNKRKAQSITGAITVTEVPPEGEGENEPPDSSASQSPSEQNDKNPVSFAQQGKYKYFLFEHALVIPVERADNK